MANWQYLSHLAFPSLNARCKGNICSKLISVFHSICTRSVPEAVVNKPGFDNSFCYNRDMYANTMHAQNLIRGTDGIYKHRMVDMTTNSVTNFMLPHLKLW